MFTINEGFKSYLKKEGLSSFTTRNLSEDDTQEFDDYNLYLELKKAFFAGFAMALDGPTAREANFSLEEVDNLLKECKEEFTLFWKEISSNEK